MNADVRIFPMRADNRVRMYAVTYHNIVSKSDTRYGEAYLRKEVPSQLHYQIKDLFRMQQNA